MSPKLFIIKGLNFLYHIYYNRYLLYELIKRDFKQRYITNLLGLSWAIIDPLALMLIFWLIFGIGFRSGATMDVPFVAYLITGLTAYTFFQGALSQATSSIKSYNFLLNKVNFQVSILPLVKVISEYLVHLIVILVMIAILLLHDIQPSIFWLQFFYYSLATGALLLGLSWFSSAVYLFIPDIKSIISVLLRFFFYLSPIFWQIEMMPERFHFFIKLNPMYYIVTGYRDSFLFQRAFWEEPKLTIYFLVLQYL